jgi:hypothetical protein
MIASTSSGVRFFKIGLRRVPAAPILPGLIKLLEAVKAVARISHHFAGLADIPELLGQLKQSYLGADDKRAASPLRRSLRHRAAGYARERYIDWVH